MLRITEYLENDKAIRLRLDGTLSSESFDGVAQLCARHQSHAGQTVIVDMAGVNFMHDAAARKLARLRTESVRVINCSPFIAALLDTAKNLEWNHATEKGNRSGGKGEGEDYVSNTNFPGVKFTSVDAPAHEEGHGSNLRIAKPTGAAQTHAERRSYYRTP